jgi:hypothetical protein
MSARTQREQITQLCTPELVIANVSGSAQIGGDARTCDFLG